jgi:hypothetical protein
MNDKDLMQTIKNQTVQLPNSGIDRFPGYFLRLDSDQLQIEDKVIDVYIEAWYDADRKNKYQKSVNNFIVHYSHTYIIVDFFYEAKAVWDYLLKTYPC